MISTIVALLTFLSISFAQAEEFKHSPYFTQRVEVIFNSSQTPRARIIRRLRREYKREGWHLIDQTVLIKVEGKSTCRDYEMRVERPGECETTGFEVIEIYQRDGIVDQLKLTGTLNIPSKNGNEINTPINFWATFSESTIQRTAIETRQ